MFIDSKDEEGWWQVGIELESVKLTADTNGLLMITRPDGEGMEMGQQALEDFLLSYLRENF